MSALLKPTGLRVTPASATSMTVTWEVGGPNLVPTTATYSANAYTLNGLTPGRRYVWTKGAAETQLTNASVVYKKDTESQEADSAWNNGRVYFTAHGASVVLAGAGATGAVLGTVREVSHNLDVIGDGSGTVVVTDGQRNLSGIFRFLNGILFLPNTGLGWNNLVIEFEDDGTLLTDAAEVTVVGGSGTVTITINVNSGVTRAITVENAIKTEYPDWEDFLLAAQASGYFGSGTTGNFEVWRDGALLQTVSSSTLTITDSGLTQLTHYSYRVRAVDANGNSSEFSASASGVTPSSTSNPGFPVEFGSAHYDTASVVVVDGSGNVFTSGYFEQPGEGYFSFLSKIDTNGNLVWCKCFPVVSSMGGVTSIGLDSNGEIIIAGWFRGTVDFGSGPMASQTETDGYIAKFSSAGILKRAIIIDSGGPYQGAGDDRIHSMAVDSANNIIVACTTNQGAGQGPVLRKYTTDLALTWKKAFVHSGDTFDLRVAVDSANNIILGGSFVNSINLGAGTLTSAGSGDFFIGKLNGTNGNCIWQFRYGGVYGEGPRALTVDSGNNVLVTGRHFHQASFGGAIIGPSFVWGIFVAKYDTNGAHVWSKSFGSDGFQRIMSEGIVAGTGDAVFVGGYTGIPIRFAGTTHGEYGTESGFVAEYTSGGVETTFTLTAKILGMDTAPSSKLVLAGLSASQNVLIARMDQ